MELSGPQRGEALVLRLRPAFGAELFPVDQLNADILLCRARVARLWSLGYILFPAIGIDDAVLSRRVGARGRTGVFSRRSPLDCVASLVFSFGLYAIEKNADTPANMHSS